MAAVQVGGGAEQGAQHVERDVDSQAGRGEQDVDGHVGDVDGRVGHVDQEAKEHVEGQVAEHVGGTLQQRT